MDLVKIDLLALKVAVESRHQKVLRALLTISLHQKLQEDLRPPSRRLSNRSRLARVVVDVNQTHPKSFLKKRRASRSGMITQFLPKVYTSSRLLNI